jgi:hypothetical protein
MDAARLHRKMTGLLCYVAESRPGDVIAFGWDTWHASVHGTDRRQWTISYAKDPATAEEAERLREFLQSVVPDGDGPYDHAAYPLLRPALADQRPRRPQRAALSTRMRELGVFDTARS